MISLGNGANALETQLSRCQPRTSLARKAFEEPAVTLDRSTPFCTCSMEELSFHHR